MWSGPARKCCCAVACHPAVKWGHRKEEGGSNRRHQGASRARRDKNMSLSQRSRGLICRFLGAFKQGQHCWADAGLFCTASSNADVAPSAPASSPAGLAWGGACLKGAPMLTAHHHAQLRCSSSTSSTRSSPAPTAKLPDSGELPLPAVPAAPHAHLCLPSPPCGLAPTLPCPIRALAGLKLELPNSPRAALRLGPKLPKMVLYRGPWLLLIRTLVRAKVVQIGAIFSACVLLGGVMGAVRKRRWRWLWFCSWGGGWRWHCCC